jgi:gas vesicle protein
MKRLKSILVVAAIFLFGAVVGGIIGSSAALVDFVNKTFRGGPANVRRILVQRAKHDLQLDEDQSHQFWQILNETGTELRDATKPVHPQIDATLGRTVERLRAVLRPGQQPRFDALMKDAQIRWQEAMSGPAPKPPNPEQPEQP